MRTTLRRSVATLTVATVGLGGYAAWSAAAAPEASYRSAVVSTGDVAQTLDLTGTVGSDGRSDLGFATSGTVAEVLVEQGDRVRAGQVVARLDRRSLRAAVARARADLAAARAQLEDDETAQADTVTESVSSDTTSTTTPTGAAQSQPSTDQSSEQSTQQSTGTSTENAGEQSAEPSAALTQALTALADQQEAVTSASSAATTALAEAATALEAQTAACAAAFTADPVEVPTEEATAASDATDASDPAPAEDPDDAACTAALATVQDAQVAVSQAQDDLRAALDELATTLTDAVGEIDEQDTAAEPEPDSQPTQSTEQTQQTEQPAQQQAQQSSTQATAGEQSAAPSGDGGQTVTAATLARDQAAIDEARAALVAAEQELGGAVLVAPHAGRIVDLGVAAGDDVSAGSDLVVLVAGGLTTVSVAASTDEVRQLATGQSAQVTPAGATQSVPGTVTAIAVAPTTSESGETTYAVTVSLTERGLDLPEGVSAETSVVVDEARDVLTVPLSALGDGFVQVLDGTTTTRTRVGTGIVGSSTVEVTEGLEAGDRVVLADLTADVPTSGSDTGSTGFGGGGGPGGAPQMRMR